MAADANGQRAIFRETSPNPLTTYREHISGQIAAAAGVENKIAFNALQKPNSADKGDLVLAIGALRIKDKRKQDEQAKDLGAKLNETELVKKPAVDKTFISFWFDPKPLVQLVVPSILKLGSKYGFDDTLGLRDPADPSKGRKKIIVEFSSPNIAKEFHAGHLRSTIIGGFISNLYQAMGWDVTRMNYLGDWGRQYGILALGFERFGSEEELQKNPIDHLYKVYVQITNVSGQQEDAIKAKQQAIKNLQAENQPIADMEGDLERLQNDSVNQHARDYFKRMVDGDAEALATWKRFRDLSIERYKQTYARLNIEFDDYNGESTVKQSSMDKAAEVMAEKKVSEESEGAVIVDLTPHSKKLGKAVVKKKDGTSLYLTRDVGAITERYDKYHFDKMIYVVASQQDLHLAQLFKIVELMGRKDISEKCQHINFGMVKKMSTRKGTAKFLNDILREGEDKMHEVMKTNQDKYEQVEDPKRTADILGISAVMVQDMKAKRVNDYEFDLNRMTSFEGDTGPYLQYSHARLCSITRKARESGSGLSDEELLKADLSLLTEQSAIDLVRMLAQWPDVVGQTIKNLEPSTILTYLFHMTHEINASYQHLRVVGSEKELLKARLALYTAARQVLWNGMRLLGLSPLERM